MGAFHLGQGVRGITVVWNPSEPSLTLSQAFLDDRNLQGTSITLSLSLLSGGAVVEAFGVCDCDHHWIPVAGSFRGHDCSWSSKTLFDLDGNRSAPRMIVRSAQTSPHCALLRHSPQCRTKRYAFTQQGVASFAPQLLGFPSDEANWSLETEVQVRRRDGLQPTMLWFCLAGWVERRVRDKKMPYLVSGIACIFSSTE